MNTDVFQLQIIPVSDILPHEEFDEKRALPLVEKLKKEKELVNPILVATLDNGKYLQLDGMNRLSAFKMMGIHTILAQIIDYNNQDSVELASWLHLFKSDLDKFLEFVTSVEGLSLETADIDRVGNRYIREDGTARLCTIVARKGDVRLVVSDGNLYDKIEKMNKIVSYYRNQITRDVLPHSSRLEYIRLVFSEHPEANLMVIFPTFTRHQIIDVVNHGKLLPAGITRHVIHRRCLNVKVPLSLFDSKQNLDGQNKTFEHLLYNRSFRVYEEPTVYFE